MQPSIIGKQMSASGEARQNWCRIKHLPYLNFGIYASG
jgi:hypothetical protein